MKKYYYILILVLIILFGRFLSVYHLSKYGIDGDELTSAGIANGLLLTEPINDIFTNIDLQKQNTIKNVLRANIAGNGGNNMFYYVILHYWALILGNSDFILRLLSVIFTLLLIPLSFVFANKMFNSQKLGLLTAFFFAIQPVFIEDAHNARAYSMAIFFTFLSSYFFYLIITDKNSKLKIYIFYVSASIISLLCHYLTAYIFISHLIIFILYVRQKNICINYILSGIAICILFGIWMWIGGLEGFKDISAKNTNYKLLASQYSQGDNPFLMPATLKNIITGWFQVWLQIFGNILQDFGFRIRQIAVLILIPFSIIWITFTLNRKNHDDNRKMIFLMILTFTQILFATTLAIKAGHCISFQPLYAGFATPYATILIAFSIYTFYYNNKTKITGILSFILITSLMLISSWQTYTDTRGNLPPRGANLYEITANKIASNYTKGKIIAINNPLDAKLINLYFSSRDTIFQKIDATSDIKIFKYVPMQLKADDK